MKVLKTQLFLMFLLACITSVGQTQVPEGTLLPGTLLPAMLSSSIDSHKNRPGDEIKARLMQDVPLGNGHKLPAGTRVVGEITDVKPSMVTLRFDRLFVRNNTIAIRTNLRALASMTEISDAQLPTNTVSGDFGSSVDDWNTVQVGGDVVYGRRGGPVMHGSSVVGHSLLGNGVLAVPEAASDSTCRADISSETPQAMWLFSASACGTYGYPDLSIAHAGRSEPIGIVVLAAPDRVRITAGSGVLLRVTGD
jgi:hypothetical protein